MAIADKELTKQALDQLGGNLGLQPVDNANEIMDRAGDAAGNKPKVKSYLQPYVDRVERQQKSSRQKFRNNVNSILKRNWVRHSLFLMFSALAMISKQQSCLSIHAKDISQPAM